MKFNKVIKIVAVSSIVASMSAVVGNVYGKPYPIHTPENLVSAPPIVVGEWTESDKPYKEAERKIAKDYTDGKNMQSVLKQWQQLAANNPKDPVIRFAVIFASRGAYRVAKPDDMLPYSLVETLAKYDPGNVHEYTRFRFCMTEEAEKQLPLQNAEAIGKKLLQYNPKDTLVKINLIYMLCDSNHAQAALPYAQQWVKAEPNTEKAHSSLALVYQNLWFATKNKSYGRLAIQQFQQFLHNATPGDGFRERAENSIKVLQEDIAEAS